MALDQVAAVAASRLRRATSLVTGQSRPSRTRYLWSYGLDDGEFFGEPQDHDVKDMPLSRLKEGNVLVAYELNGEPLKQKNGFPARLVIPGFTAPIA